MWPRSGRQPRWGGAGRESMVSEGRLAVGGTRVPLSPQIPVKTRSAATASTPPPPPPPPATPRKNKAAMCKPLMQNRGVSCKVEMKSKGSQTGEPTTPQAVLRRPRPKSYTEPPKKALRHRAALERSSFGVTGKHQVPGRMGAA